jgi:hypothetical protein
VPGLNDFSYIAILMDVVNGFSRFFKAGAKVPPLLGLAHFLVNPFQLYLLSVAFLSVIFSLVILQAALNNNRTATIFKV